MTSSSNKSQGAQITDHDCQLIVRKQLLSTVSRQLAAPSSVLIVSLAFLTMLLSHFILGPGTAPNLIFLTSRILDSAASNFGRDDVMGVYNNMEEVNTTSPGVNPW